MQNEFSAHEADMIALHLSNYQDSPSPKDPLAPEVRERLCQSAIKKLVNLSPLTCFSKQEYSVMFFAVQHFADVMHANGEQLTPEAYTLIDKLYTKAGGTLTHPN